MINKQYIMKKIFFAGLISMLLFANSSCLKDKGCQNKTVQSEAAAISAYATANGINGTTHSSGVVYEVTVPGSGARPTPYSKVSIRYVGKLLDGTVFDSQLTNTVTFNLGESIAGFQIALQQVQKGGSIRFIIPSSLAYGCSGQNTIPSNAILYFEVQLIDIL
jgi:FKBP-type peptidyl-prolyl cis-trans isomerase